MRIDILNKTESGLFQMSDFALINEKKTTHKVFAAPY